MSSGSYPPATAAAPLCALAPGGTPPVARTFARAGDHRQDVDQCRRIDPRAGESSGETTKGGGKRRSTGRRRRDAGWRRHRHKYPGRPNRPRRASQRQFLDVHVRPTRPPGTASTTDRSRHRVRARRWSSSHAPFTHARQQNTVAQSAAALSPCDWATGQASERLPDGARVRQDVITLESLELRRWPVPV
jgi:hypothetical protein